MLSLRNRDISREIESSAHRSEREEKQNSYSNSPQSSNSEDNQQFIESLFSDMADEHLAPPPSSDDGTNPYAFKIDLKDKIGNSLFLKATQGLDKEDKISLSNGIYYLRKLLP